MGELLVDHEGLRAAACGPVFVNAWMCPPTVAQLTRLLQAQRAYRDARLAEQGKHLVFSMVDPRVGKVMDAETRALAKAVGDEMLPSTLGHCYVVLGTGFFAAMARSVITGVQILGRYDYEWKVVASVDEGVPWSVAEVARHGFSVDANALSTLARSMLT